MSSVWDRFDTIANPDEVAEAKKKFEPILAGDYEVVLEKIEPSESQQGLPMLKGQFRTIEGGKVVFYNQMLQNITKPEMTAVNIAEAVNFVSGLIGEEYDFKGLAKFASDVESIPTGGIYTINVSYGKKDTEMKYPKLRVKERVIEAIEESEQPFEL